jgi:hypothetical protein
VTSLTTLPKVSILYSYIEPDAALIKAAISGGAKGLVFAGTGNGALSVFEETVLKEIDAMPALASRRSCDRAASATAASLPPRVRRARRDSERHAESTEGADPADARADEDERSEGDSKDFFRVLKRSLSAWA